MQEKQTHQRKECQQDGDRALPNSQHDGFEEVGKHIIAHAHQRHRQKGLEGMEIHDLHTEQNHDCRTDHVMQDPGDLFGEHVTDGSHQKAEGDRKQDRKTGRYVMEFCNMKNQLNISKCKGKIDRADQFRQPAILLYEMSGALFCRALPSAYGSIHDRPPLIHRF